MLNTKIHAKAIEDEDLMKMKKQVDESHDVIQRHAIIQPFGYVLTDLYIDYHQQIQDFEIFDDDVFVLTYPKCGKC